MFCEKCGADNSETAAFCRKCGVAIAEPEVETRVAVRPDGGSDGVLSELRDQEEAEIFSISPTLMFVKAGYVGAAIAALLFVAILSIFSISPTISIPLALALFLIPGFYHVKQRLVRLIVHFFCVVLLFSLTTPKKKKDPFRFTRWMRIY